MKRIIVVFLLIIISVFSVYSQSVGINTNGASPNSSAMLDIDVANKGLLIPRVALTGTNDVTTISSPETSLLIYNTATVSDVAEGFYFYDGSAWSPVGKDAYTFENGLTENAAHAVGLGGTLSGNTTIAFGSGAFGNNLIFNLVSSSSQFTIQDDGVDNVIFYNNGNIDFKGDVSSGEYYNFESNFGESGYGFRTKIGDLEYKNSGGSWTPFPSGVTGTPYWWYQPTSASYIRPQNNDNIRIYDDGETYGLYFNGATNDYGGYFRTTGTADPTAAVVGFSDVFGNATYGYLGYDGTYTNGQSGDYELSLDGMAVYGKVEDKSRAAIFGKTEKDATVAAIIGYSDVWISGYYYTFDGSNTAKSHPALYGQLIVHSDKSGGQAAVEGWSEYYASGIGNRGYTIGGDFTAIGRNQDSKGVNVIAKSWGELTEAYGVKIDVDSAETAYGLLVQAGTEGETKDCYGVYSNARTSDGNGMIGFGSDASNFFTSGGGDGVIGVSDAGYGVFGQFDDATGDNNNYGVLGYSATKANYFYHNETTGAMGQSAGYFRRVRDSQNDGDNYWHNHTNQAVEGYNPYGDSYTFGVSGFSWDDNNGRTGGVMGALYVSSSSYAWASLGYESYGGSDYGLYYDNTYGSGTGSGKGNDIHTGVGMGGCGDFMGAWTRGNIYGATIKGDRYSLYVDGQTYTNDVIVNLTDVGDDERVATYVPTSDNPTIYLSGVGQLTDGKSLIKFDEKYQKLISDKEPVIVTVTPIGESNGLHLVSSKSSGFSVAENGKGTANIQFTWIVIATRKGYENIELPEEVISNKFDKNIDGFMYNEADTENSAQPLWWNGELQTSPIPKKENTQKEIEQPRMKVGQKEKQKDIKQNTNQKPKINKS